MTYVLHNLRLNELVAVVNANKAFYLDFVAFLEVEGYGTVLDFVNTESDERAVATVEKYLARRSEVVLYDGILRPYPNAKAKWFFLAWLLRDAATQRLQPLLTSLPGSTDIERKAYLFNELRKFIAPLFPELESWQWPALSEVMLARLEGSRRALKGTLFEGIVRRQLVDLVTRNLLPVSISGTQIQLNDETYDVQIVGSGGTMLLPVKTRETMGGGHALLFTRDIYKSITVAAEHGYVCVPIVIAESWAGDLDALNSNLYIHIKANPNQISIVEPLLAARLHDLLPLIQAICDH